MKTLKSTLLVCVMLAAIVLLSSCGVVGYEAKEKAVYKGERIKVTVESYGAAVNKDANDLAIIVVEDPNGLNQLTYSATGRHLGGLSHDPAESMRAFSEIIKAFPVDFWQALYRLADTMATDPNSN
jgi:hypothetical protein